VSVDALMRRAVTEGGLPSIGVLVDLYNAISILEVVPIGGEDLDRYDGPARLLIATGDEPFHTTANGEPVVDHPDAGEPVWVDGGGVTCRRWNWRQTSRTAIHADTRSVGFIVDSLDAPDHAGARRAVDRLVELIPHASVRTLDATTR
jgi:DNA/RNA-binding domain of Phe-tRNA-synthetase-like protein